MTLLFSARLKPIAVALVAAAFAVNVAAALQSRGLDADGCYYLLQLIERNQFFEVEPSRRTVQWLQQAPTVAAMRLGALHSASAAAIVFSLTLSLLPLLLVAACYPVLPQDRKEWFFFPLLHYFAGSTAAAFPGIVEGPVAAAYFWLLLFAILFRTEKTAHLIAIGMIAWPVIYLHEVMVVLAPVLAVAAAWQGLSARSSSKRAFLWLLAAWFLVVTAVQVGFVLHPRSPENRAYFVHDLLHLVWLTTPWGHTNIPAVLGMLSLILVSGLALRPRGRNPIDTGRGLSLAISAFGLTCLGAVISSIYVDGFVAPALQFKARNIPALVSLPLSLLALGSVIRESLRDTWIRLPNLAILLWLGIGTLGWHVVATVYWADYLHAYRRTLAEYRGLISWEEAVGGLPARQRALFERMSYAWTNPTMSILLSPGGSVSTIIANPSNNRWQPFDPADPTTLPRSGLFDTSVYRARLAAGP